MFKSSIALRTSKLAFSHTAQVRAWVATTDLDRAVSQLYVWRHCNYCVTLTHIGQIPAKVSNATPPPLVSSLRSPHEHPSPRSSPWRQLLTKGSLQLIMWSAASQLRISPSKPDDHDEELRRLSRVTGGSRATLRLDVAAFVRAHLARNSEQTLVAVCHWPGVAIDQGPAIHSSCKGCGGIWVTDLVGRLRPGD